MSAPELPDEFDWPTRTVAWWGTWSSSPLTADFTAVDWDFMLDTALIHAAFWSGDTGAAGELRARTLRVEQVAAERAKSNPKPGGTALDEFTRRRSEKQAPSTKGASSK